MRKPRSRDPEYPNFYYDPLWLAALKLFGGTLLVWVFFVTLSLFFVST